MSGPTPPHLIRYTSLLSPRIDPFLFTAIGIAAYILHERDALKGREDERLVALVRRKWGRIVEGRRGMETRGDDAPAGRKEQQRQGQYSRQIDESCIPLARPAPATGCTTYPSPADLQKAAETRIGATAAEKHDIHIGNPDITTPRGHYG
ncbi:uncharacterized protein EV422DRAFT_622681 [Fimicolochytrium jonesii]|uniref:uncharacterized protein n=1 Tax=Fimicolochytrium jonesii TaxID=1396493 RepID=UPI0022FEA41F|nr:uncharacterized protein EV422DRAFT_622681 [Fimicolochytrium jonesii]KAI8817466.1 hypothetical protein EV422DRAFT_622681 [Fimicolochytrium jonesii]